MNRFINPTRSNQYHASIKKMSDLSRPISSGVSRAYCSNKFTWIGDFLHKKYDNIAFNKNKCYIDFISNYDAIMQEYGQVEKLWSSYDFISKKQRLPLSGNQVELTSKQYYLIGQKHAEFNSVEYLCPTKIDTRIGTIDSPVEGYPARIVPLRHGFYRAPYYGSFGYRASSNAGDSYKYLICNNYLVDSHDHQSSISMYGIKVNQTSPMRDITYIERTWLELNTSLESRMQMLNISMAIDNVIRSYFDGGKQEWVAYNDVGMGFVSMYDSEWLEMYSENTIVSFYPRVSIRGYRERAKTIAKWMFGTSASSGYLCLNPGTHGENDDQSKLVYNICKIMTTQSGGYNTISRAIAGESVFAGIEAESERNKRYSAIVTTEPYFKADPICEGEVIDYSFVNDSGESVHYPSYGINGIAPNQYLRLRAPLNVIKEIDRLLALGDVNTDIIQTIEIKKPTSLPWGSIAFNNDSSVYTSIKKSDINDEYFFKRQDACIDDIRYDNAGLNLLHNSFIIPGGDSALYTGGNIKVSGIGYVARPSGASLMLYCCNYTPKKYPIGTALTGVVQILPNLSSASNITNNEIFRPMIKIAGVNGYIKIIERNKSLPEIRSKDGLYEVTYCVEFPYCHGSLIARQEFNSTAAYRKTQILYKSCYINAGSWVIGSDGRYDDSNQRYAPNGDDSMVRHCLLTQKSSDDPYTLNGSEYTPPSINPDKRAVAYPAASVWKNIRWDSFGIIKPNGSRSALYEVKYPTSVSGDLKIMVLSDTRMWSTGATSSHYINRENPSYVCEIDISAVVNDYTKYQKMNGAIPDMKRWLYGYFQGFAKTSENPSEINSNGVDTEKVSTVSEDYANLDPLDSESNIVIEIWDKDAVCGNESSKGNWKIFSPTVFDSNNTPGSIILENLFIVKDSVVPVYTKAEQLWSMSIGRFILDDASYSATFPDLGLSDKENLVLYGPSTELDSNNNPIMKAYHVSYISTPIPDVEFYTCSMYVRGADLDTEILTHDISELDISNGPFSIAYPKSNISNNPVGDIRTSFSAPNTDEKIVTRYIDAQLRQYADDSNKVMFRVRVCNRKESPISNDEPPILQYTGNPINESHVAKNKDYIFPWGPLGTVDTGFDYQKMGVREITTKFGMNYFKCQSV